MNWRANPQTGAQSTQFVSRSPDHALMNFIELFFPTTQVLFQPLPSLSPVASLLDFRNLQCHFIGFHGHSAGTAGDRGPCQTHGRSRPPRERERESFAKMNRLDDWGRGGQPTRK